MNKVAVCGKGGSGKSSVVALLAQDLHSRGWRVLVVDSDESNPGLARMLGFETRPRPLLELVGGKKQVFKAFSDSPRVQESVLQQNQIRTQDLPSAYVAQGDGILMACIGKILQSLEGCACPMGVLCREFLSRLSLGQDELALVDTEAGVEHFGRGMERYVDTVIVVTEPSFDSLKLAEKITALAGEVQVKRTWAVLNKVTSREMGLELAGQLHRRGVSVLGSIRYDPEVFQCGLEGRPLRGSLAEQDVAAIVDQLL
jgi:CO dehydrogenase maturation factor